jgi:hypothetical protein
MPFAERGCAKSAHDASTATRDRSKAAGAFLMTEHLTSIGRRRMTGLLGEAFPMVPVLDPLSPVLPPPSAVSESERARLVAALARLIREAGERAVFRTVEFFGARRANIHIVERRCIAVDLPHLAGHARRAHDTALQSQPAEARRHRPGKDSAMSAAVLLPSASTS